LFDRLYVLLAGGYTWGPWYSSPRILNQFEMFTGRDPCVAALLATGACFLMVGTGRAGRGSARTGLALGPG
jgi:hypothetical protein